MIVAVGRTFGNYRIEGLLADGPVSRVYHASRLDQPWSAAVKIVDEQISSDPDFVDRFLRDAERMATIHHPSIVEILASGRVDGHCYLIMELCPHGSARTLINRSQATGQSLSTQLCLDIVRQATVGLAFAHEHGIIHAGLKPENLLLGSSTGIAENGHWNVKIGDLGLHRPTKPDSGDDSLNSAYFAPEQRRGGDPDQRSDLYALGAILSELLTGQLPVVAEDTTQTSQAVPQPDPSQASLPRGIKELIDRCMAQDPNDRFATAAELLTTLDEMTIAGVAGRLGQDETDRTPSSPPDAHHLTLRPLGKRSGRQTVYQIEVSNDGARIAHFSLEARDDSHELRYQFSPKLVSVEPRRSRTVVLTAIDRQRFTSGGLVDFVVIATPSEGLPVAVRGVFERATRSPFSARQAFAGFGAVGVIVVTLVVLVFGMLVKGSSSPSIATPDSFEVAKSPATAPAPTTTPAVTPTPSQPPPSPPVTTPPLIVRRIDTVKNQVALTFSVSNDSGSAAKVTQLLQTLRDRNVRATFSIRGDWAASHPEVVKAIIAAGHQIINETYDHASFTGTSDRSEPLPSAQRVEELAKAGAIVQQIAEYDMKPYYRPPFGDIDTSGVSTVAQDAERAGYTIAVLWSIDTRSWLASQTVGKMISEASSAEPGDIILFSISDTGGDKDVTALPQIVDNLQARGLGFATVKELVGR